jgi:hypothetical protein
MINLTLQCWPECTELALNSLHAARFIIPFGFEGLYGKCEFKILLSKAVVGM